MRNEKKIGVKGEKIKRNKKKKTAPWFLSSSDFQISSFLLINKVYLNWIETLHLYLYQYDDVNCSLVRIFRCKNCVLIFFFLHLYSFPLSYLLKSLCLSDLMLLLKPSFISPRSIHILLLPSLPTQLSTDFSL